MTRKDDKLRRSRPNLWEIWESLSEIEQQEFGSFAEFVEDEDDSYADSQYREIDAGR
jgi:hypothetical protein